ncbi:unnamed protein product [Medioppia subpectinata]|uniref:Uncharacterized protein n=1 Tax=Medioppia subpectinata TaxID=1979941 RepID=A0A7R9PUS3_9ACAR|nr:unnamed protein product [Medioppia subpectinata]CAG2101538.1 unnamed protein product [Medioppia subpectinata]
MKGYFEFDVLANDTDGLADSATVFIYLLRDDQRVRFILRLTPQELREKLDKFRDVLANITGATVNIDSYKIHENRDGSVDQKKTDLYLHFVNRDDNSILEVNDVLSLIDKNLEYLDELYKEFNVLVTEPTQSLEYFLEWEDQLKACLLGTTAFLALLLILVICLCLNQKSRYERQLKAATVPVFGSESQLTRCNVPNTNQHASEGSNPMWMTGYDNRWYDKDEEQISNRSSGDNSLDENAIASHSPDDSLDGSAGRESGGSASTTTNDKQALCRGAKTATKANEYNGCRD